jgi:hypothetical protein
VLAVDAITHTCTSGHVAVKSPVSWPRPSAVALHIASPELTAEITTLHGFRREEDRVQQWRIRHH